MNLKIKKPYLWVLVGILIIALIVRIFVFGAVTTGHSQDSYWFIKIGENFIKDYVIELNPGQKYDLSQPLHPVLLGLSSLVFKNLFFNGKLFSLISGMLVILFVYILWKKLEDKKTALLASFFIAFAALSLKFSVAIREDSLYMVLLVISLFFIYKSKDNEKFMPLASILIVLSSLTRWEGYMLIPTALISFFIWKRKEIFNEKSINIKPFANKYVVLSLIIIIVPLFFWSMRSYEMCNCGLSGMIPSYGYQQQLSAGSGGSGFSYLSHIPNFIPWYFLIFILFGLIFSFKKYKKYFPIYLFLIFDLFIHMKFRGKAEQILYITPILYGFMAMVVLDIKRKISENNVDLGRIFLVLFIGLFLVSGTITGYETTKEWGARNDVIRDSMLWLEENSIEQDKVLVGGVIVYSYFTSREIINYGLVFPWIDYVRSQNPSIEFNNPTTPFAAFLSSNNIKYFVAYDSTMEWFYTNTKSFAQRFEKESFEFPEKTITLNPVKRFEANDEEVILFEVIDE